MALTSQPRRAKTVTKRRGPSPLVPILLILAGIAVLIYPIVGTFYNNYKQAEFANKYAATVEQTDTATLAQAVADARLYNKQLPPEALYDPWNGQADTNSEEYRRYLGYLSQLSAHDAMARLRIPSIKVDMPIRHGTEDDTLARGVGHLYGTSLPVGGANTHSAITAHSGWANATMFDRVPEMQVGDLFFIDVYGETLAYRVDQIHVVLPNNFDHLVRDDGDHVTLITCTPRAVNSHRLLVRGTRTDYQVPPTSDNPLRTMDWTIAEWMYPRLIAAGGALVLIIVLVVVSRRGRKTPATEGS